MLIMYNGLLSCMGDNVAARSRAVVRIEVRGMHTDNVQRLVELYGRECRRQIESCCQARG